MAALGDLEIDAGTAKQAVSEDVGSLEVVWWAKLPEADRSSKAWSGRIKLMPLDAVLSGRRCHD